MQQTSSQQLKCYGRRNRAKPEASSVESGHPLVKDLRGATLLEEVSPAATSNQSVDVVGQVKKPHASRGRPRKVVGAPKQGARSLSDVVSNKVRATRSSAGKSAAPVASEVREVARDSTVVEETVSEGSSLMTPVQPQDRVPVRVKIVGPFSNGGSKYAKGKNFGSPSPGSQKTRGQFTRQEAQRAADNEVSDEVQSNQGKDDGQAADEEQLPFWTEVDGSPIRERKDTEEEVIHKREKDKPVIEVIEVANSPHERESGEEQVTHDRDRRQPVPEKTVSRKFHCEESDVGEEVIGKKVEGRSSTERRVSGKSYCERRDGVHPARGKELPSAQSTLASRRRLVALRKRQHEDSVLAQADEILLKQEFLESNKDKKGQPKSKEPARPKTHWDFVIEEMTWLAKDFERERKWKLVQAKKVALRVNRSKLDVVARENRKLKEEEQRMRKVASNIAKDVRKFWLKVEKLVSYKQQLLVEERKKKALDKHLDFLLGQTERYSTMLAENLADTTTTYELQISQPLPSGPKDGPSTIAQVLPVVSEEPLVASDVDNLDGAVRMEVEGGDDDFMVEEEDEPEDDETTLEADEALITEDERKEELSALERESELPLEDLLNAYKLMRGDSASEADDEEDDSGETDEDDGIVKEGVAEDSNYALSGDIAPVDEFKKSPILTSEGPSGLASERSLGQLHPPQGCLGSTGDGLLDEIASVPPLLNKEKEFSREGTIDASVFSNDTLVVQLGIGGDREANMTNSDVGRELPPFSEERAAGEAAGNPAKLVVELTHQNSVPVNSSSTRVKSEKLEYSGLEPLEHPIGELQDDKEYMPTVLGDEPDENDDERTLEEEERIAKEEGDSNINEIDQLKLESEMSLEELLAKYRSGMDFDGEDIDDFSVDRRDRTSEAGTSGSSSDEEDDEEEAHYIVDAKERMGEPSTSGRDYQSLPLTEMEMVVNSPKIINTLEVKQEVVEANLLDNNKRDFQKMDVYGKAFHADAHDLRRDGALGAGSSNDTLFSTSLLLGGDDEVDADTAAALAKVTAAARRRGDRIMMRSSNESRGIQVIDEPSKTEISKMGGTKQSPNSDETLVLPALSSSMLNEDTGIHTSDPVKNKVLLANGGSVCDLENLADGVAQEPEYNIQDKSKNIVNTIHPVTLDKDQSIKVVDQTPVEQKTLEVGDEKNSEDRLADFAAAAQSAQPTGYTFSTTKVKTKLPFLLKHSLREYQHIGLDWLVTMYEKRLNGILADEMGLGKTIMTIALLAHLACEKGIWGPHLIVVPTSVMLNWETEFMKWCPAFKILTYFGNAKERKLKRQGWSRPNSFHVCITTYRLVIQDAKAFKRKKWKYLILDEAHLIKNWKSQRWQTLLNFNSKRRILLTGTPLQNDLMELWSLMHFLMPHVFQSHQEFRDWFCNPITGMVEGEDQVNKELVDRLHNVLRPFLLRRLKKDVEKQLPGKFEHVIRCRLSKRQRNLYEDFMASSDTQATLSSGNFLGLINVLMQLRKVCNHPDLFEGRPIVSSFDMPGIEVHLSSATCSAMSRGPFDGINTETLNLKFNQLSGTMNKWEADEVVKIKTPGPLIVELASTGEDTWNQHYSKHKPSKEVRGVLEEIHSVLRENRKRRRRERDLAMSMLNEFRCNRQPLYGADFLKSVEVLHPVYDVHRVGANPRNYLEFSSIISDIVQLPLTRCEHMMDLISAFVFAIPAARAPLPVAWCSHLVPTSSVLKQSISEEILQQASSMLVPLRPVVVRRQLFFPDRRLLQFDCGKLQELAVLLRRLKSQGHRALIFTQMTKMLDVLESFINLYGYTYMRLDGSTKPEQRQILMQRFNTNPKIFLFILSTRSGGVGINLVGADTVIFYDSDWNPAMDLQAQDRCHRIGQTREVHIYRLISESTIEENILKKANQKRILDDLVIQSGGYNTEFFKKLDPMELFSGLKGIKVGGSSDKSSGTTAVSSSVISELPDTSSIKIFGQKELSSAEVEAALKNAEDEADYMAMKRVEQEEAAENQEFTEELFAGNLDDEDLADDLDENGRSGKVQTDAAVVDGPSAGEKVLEDGGTGVGIEDITFGESSILPTDADEEIDMLADVRQMAAAAAASGRGSVSFEDQLRPVERYAMKFLELWDPRVDNMAVAQVAFEEKEWELDQLEKLKEEQEAEIDEDNEPLFYETWDTALADEAYRQQVDILVQQQKQLEWEAMEEEMRDADRALAEAASTVRGAENVTLKSKGRKKLKKAKFKSLAEGSLMSDSEDKYIGEGYQVERSNDPSYKDVHSDIMSLPHRSPSQRKRKAPKLLEEDSPVDTHTKKLKKDYVGKDTGAPGDKGKRKQRTLEDNIFRTIFGISSDDKSPGSTRPESVGQPGGVSIAGVQKSVVSSGKEKGGKLTISGMPPKKGPLIMLEKERKKDSLKSQDQLPPASPWTHGEDAVLCAVVHEYGGNWQLASDALGGGPDGGVYRGRHRHPIHCRERFRQLLAQNASAASGDPTSEKSALGAATNAQLKVTEEHTKRLLDAVLQLPDQELLLQRHFVAALAAMQNWRRVAAQHSSEKLPTSVAANSPSGVSFVSLRSLVNSHTLSIKAGAVKRSSREVSAALAQVERETKLVSNRASVKPQLSKDLPFAAENVKFNVTQFLVGSPEYGESTVNEGDLDLRSQGVSVPLTFEDLLGSPSPSSPSRPNSKAVRNLAEMLVENRFRFATKISWDGATRDWAAAGGSGTGVLGLHIPNKGKGVLKRKPVSDPSKPPKAKLMKTSKSSMKKGLRDATFSEPSPGLVGNGGDLSTPSGHDGGVNGKEAVLGATSGRSSSLLQKTSAKRLKMNAKNSELSTSAPADGQLDLNDKQPDTQVLDAKVPKKVKKSSPGVGISRASKISHTMEKKSLKRVDSQSGPATNSEGAACPRVGLEHSCGNLSTDRTLPMRNIRKDLSAARVGDGCSDDDVTIVGVSPGNRYNMIDSPVADPSRKLETPRRMSKNSEIFSATRSNFAELGSSDELGFLGSRSTGTASESFNNEDSSLASHLMNRLSGTSAQDLVSLGVSEGLSHVQWPPAPGSWPVPSLHDFDFPADLPSLSFSEGKQKAPVVSPFRSSLPGQGEKTPGKASSPKISRLRMSEGAPRLAHLQEETGQMPARLLHRTDSNNHSQGVGRHVASNTSTGGSDRPKQLLRFSPSSMRSASEIGSPLLHHVSSPRSLKGSSHDKHPSVSPRMYPPATFSGVTPLAFSSPETPIDTGLELSLGSNAVHKLPAGVRPPRDLQPHTSPP
ncbi:protein PHOTOPERIOD-INDEPENDENT EARLY FLOWERING 1 isoform X2 [Physcomitrium patens]|uniref:protein PHOTOPERIOD-INDEPENDENT EARLY FLOWERING 1 isoform X2 n=1 Tax=Physcomitrium patens TaxID=3218 RepID=UPI000D17E49B|nr:protein PHOTOPERIOD-INDEPENDENT EARLY FLOWERING 1-like isoform X2 [Physcomitrium patens]|eukprot:XP_024385974.1 protein PHOTOPERIOD-INDEPENDENT EARLY FLOWERING 1-like isoform X2 [Physcomitrella patens]